jgi:hypothetical protein
MPQGRCRTRAIAEGGIAAGVTAPTATAAITVAAIVTTAIAVMATARTPAVRTLSHVCMPFLVAFIIVCAKLSSCLSVLFLRKKVPTFSFA